MDSNTTSGPASYDDSSRPTVTLLELKQIRSVNDVQMHSDDPDYVPIPLSISGNVVTFKVMTPSALSNHQHDITTVSAAGGGNALTEPSTPGAIESAGAGQTNTDAVDAASGGTPTQAEVANTTNISAVTFTAIGSGW